MKWRFADIRKYMNMNGKNFDYVFEQMCENVAKTLIGVDGKFVDPVNRHPTHRNNSFELFGFDFLVDSKLKVWLIEVKNQLDLTNLIVF